MKLWILRPVEEREAGDDPWDPWYDKTFGFVIRAESEQRAREIANDNAGSENRGEFLMSRIANTTTPWLDCKYSSCVELPSDGEEGMIIEDNHRA